MVVATVLAQGTGLLGGPGLIVWLVLALGGAMAAGNLMAIMRPPARTRDGELERAPLLRSAVMAGVGLVAALWAAASLLS